MAKSKGDNKDTDSRQVSLAVVKSPCHNAPCTVSKDGKEFRCTVCCTSSHSSLTWKAKNEATVNALKKGVKYVYRSPEATKELHQWWNRSK